MRRRDFIAGLGSAAAWPLPARSQQPTMPVIGWLYEVPGTMERILPRFSQGLAETGYIVGRNVTITSREGARDRLPALAADLVRQHVTVIAVVGVTAAQVAKAATQTIPVVFGIAGDPVEAGVVASLNRPSGNLTGVTTVSSEIAGKRLELLHKLVPAADTIAMLARQPGSAFIQAETSAMQSAARVLGVHLLVLYAATESEVAAAFATLVEQHAGALVTSSNVFFPAAIDQIISLAGRYAVPTLVFSRAQLAGGALASYGAELDETRRLMGVYAGRILKGEKPADLPVLQPTKFEFVINLKTAKALGLTIPETLLATADEVID
jgi:putative tryptophan/tyrosine transport system substrate-binding protein